MNDFAEAKDMSHEELITEAREYAPHVGSNWTRELLEGLADRLEAERGHIQSLAKWVDVAEDASSIDITCEASAALEAATTEIEYGKKRAYVDGLKRGDDLGNGYYVKRCDKGEADMKRRKAGPWLPVEGITFTPKEDK